MVFEMTGGLKDVQTSFHGSTTNSNSEVLKTFSRQARRTGAWQVGFHETWCLGTNHLLLISTRKYCSDLSADTSFSQYPDILVESLVVGMPSEFYAIFLAKWALDSTVNTHVVVAASCPLRLFVVVVTIPILVGNPPGHTVGSSWLTSYWVTHTA